MMHMSRRMFDAFEHKGIQNVANELNHDLPDSAGQSGFQTASFV
jgi:hypothetical protein